jgi:hypothetical protein
VPKLPKMPKVNATNAFYPLNAEKCRVHNLQFYTLNWINFRIQI